MKTRTDFVSNSSSCSFVLSAGMRLPEAVKFFAEVFKNCSIPWDFDDRVSVSCTAKNKWFAAVEEGVTGEKSAWTDYETNWSTGKNTRKDPEAVGWDSVRLDSGKLIEIASDDGLLGKIDGIRFQCEDGDTAGIMYLKLLYAFFERNAFCPNADDSEHSFATPETDGFIERLVIANRDIGTKD